MGSVIVASGCRQSSNANGFRSTQWIALPQVPGAFEYWGQRHRLLTMLQVYFSVAERSVVRLVQLRWQANRPELVLAWPSAPLITMAEPALELKPDRRAISVDIEGGWLVTSPSQARLVIALTRRPRNVRARIDLVNYRPRGEHHGIVRWVYRLTQARLHAWVGRRYLRQFRREWQNLGR
jgi:hypothetical protein